MISPGSQRDILCRWITTVQDNGLFGYPCAI